MQGLSLKICHQLCFHCPSFTERLSGVTPDSREQPKQGLWGGPCRGVFLSFYLSLHSQQRDSFLPGSGSPRLQVRVGVTGTRGSPGRQTRVCWDRGRALSVAVLNLVAALLFPSLPTPPPRPSLLCF